MSVDADYVLVTYLSGLRIQRVPPLILGYSRDLTLTVAVVKTPPLIAGRMFRCAGGLFAHELTDSS